MTHEDLRECVAALKHDLGKYVAWTSANLEDADWNGPVSPALLGALRRDLLATRTHDGREEPAWDVWTRLTSELERPLSIPELLDVENAVVVLQAAAPGLESGHESELLSRRGDIRKAQLLIRERLRDLHRRLAGEAG